MFINFSFTVNEACDDCRQTGTFMHLIVPDRICLSLCRVCFETLTASLRRAESKLRGDPRARISEELSAFDPALVTSDDEVSRREAPAAEYQANRDEGRGAENVKLALFAGLVSFLLNARTPTVNPVNSTQGCALSSPLRANGLMGRRSQGDADFQSTAAEESA